MSPSSSFVNPTPMAHAGTPRDILPKDEISQQFIENEKIENNKLCDKYRVLQTTCSTLDPIRIRTGSLIRRVHHRCAENLWNLRPGQSLCEGALLQPLRVHRSASSDDTENNCSYNFNLETEKSLPTKRKEKSDGFTTPPSSKISKFNDIQPNFQIELANRFKVLSQERQKTSPTDSTSTTIQNTVTAPLPNENTFNVPTPNQYTLNVPNSNYAPPPIMLKVSDTYKQQMKIITDKLPTTRGKLTGEYLKLYTNTNEFHRQLIHLLEDLKYQLYVITSKEKLPIKIVINGLPHDTKTDKIKNDLIELGFTVDKVVGHMANYVKCPLFHKPKKGSINKNNYTNVINSLIQPIVSFSNATKNKNDNNSNSKNNQEMTTRSSGISAVTSQPQANQSTVIPPQTAINLNQNQNPNDTNPYKE
ncbi:hypothetical protein TNCV_269211 [Trichonephila clavipes]|nr:hypothetical protein TNCV_269211 [Trichonephila clavipes]